MILPNTTLQSQLKALEIIVLKNPVLRAILERLPDVRLPNWYVGAGCVAQTVWNSLSSRDLVSGINDIDVVYFDSTDLSDDAEARKSEFVRSLFPEIPVDIDVKNEARIHLWYERHFGYPIEPYRSVEEAINAWPTTATAVGIRYDDDGSFAVYAPYGLNDLFGMTVRPNKVQITEEIYLTKARRWKAYWPGLTIVPWVASSQWEPDLAIRSNDLQSGLSHDFGKGSEPTC
jgi:hypothetical protein